MNNLEKSPFPVLDTTNQPMGDVCPMVKPGKGALWSAIVTLVL